MLRMMVNTLLEQRNPVLDGIDYEDQWDESWVEITIPSLYQCKRAL